MSYRKRFLVELVKQFNPTLMNNDIADVAAGIKMSFATGELCFEELAEHGLVERVGVGGNIAPTSSGITVANDPDWD